MSPTSTSGSGAVRVRAPIHGFRGPYRFLSNFWPVSVEVGGIAYPSAENAYQAAKFPIGPQFTPYFVSCTPGDAKRFARKALIGASWHARRVAVMSTIVSKKFAFGTDLAQMLIDTGDAELVETNSWGDTFWGVCDGEGENYLGRILMQVRSDLNGKALTHGNEEQSR